MECNLESWTICKEDGAEILIVSSPEKDLSLIPEAAWKQLQHSCQDLRKVHAHLMSGRKLSKQENKLHDVRSYVNKCTINKKRPGRSIKTNASPVETCRVNCGTSSFLLHFRKNPICPPNHPNPSHMKKQWSKKYFMLPENPILQKVFESCDVQCQASKILSPKNCYTTPHKLNQKD